MVSNCCRRYSLHFCHRCHVYVVPHAYQGQPGAESTPSTSSLCHDIAKLAVLAICSLMQESDASNSTTRANSSSAPEPESAGALLDWVYNTKGTFSMQSCPGEPLSYLAVDDVHHRHLPTASPQALPRIRTNATHWNMQGDAILCAISVIADLPNTWSAVQCIAAPWYSVQ